MYFQHNENLLQHSNKYLLFLRLMISDVWFQIKIYVLLVNIVMRIHLIVQSMIILLIWADLISNLPKNLYLILWVFMIKVSKTSNSLKTIIYLKIQKSSQILLINLYHNQKLYEKAEGFLILLTFH